MQARITNGFQARVPPRLRVLRFPRLRPEDSRHATDPAAVSTDFSVQSFIQAMPFLMASSVMAWLAIAVLVVVGG